MILSYLVPATLALSVNSFLIPGELDVSKADQAPAFFNYEESITLDCSSCPYALDSQRHGGHEWTNDVQSDLHMKFDTDGRSLRMNGVAFYPVSMVPPPQLHVSQTKKENEDTTFEGYKGDLRLSYGLEFDEKKAEDGSSLVTVGLEVLALDGQLSRTDNVEIKAIRRIDGIMILHSVTTKPIDPDSMDAKCGNVLCRVMAKIVTTIKKTKEQAKTVPNKIKCLCIKCYKTVTGAIRHIHKHPHQAAPPAAPQVDEDGTIKLPTHHQFRPTMIGRPMHHTHHVKGFLHRAAHVMWATMKVAFVPILIGIAFGMAASAIGMLVGQLLVFLWMKYRKTEQVIYIPVDTDEKSGLPAYEDVPSQEYRDEKEGEENA